MQDTSSALDALPARLAQVVAHAGVTQTELARRIGVSPSFISDVLRGVKRPGIEVLSSLREAFGVSVDWLLSGEGSMIGGVGIQHELFRIIRLQVAVARAAVIEQDPTARALLLLIREGQLAAVNEDPVFKEFVDRITPRENDLDLTVELYNGYQWATDPISQRRNLLAAVVAHFEARKPFDGLTALTAADVKTASVKIINKGKNSRIAGRDFYEGSKTK